MYTPDSSQQQQLPAVHLSGLDDELKATRPLLQYALIEVKSHNEKVAEKIYLELLRKLRR